MANGAATMRVVLVVAVMGTLGGCYSVRHRHDADAVVTGDQPAAGPAKKAKKEKEAKQVLPPGLGGDAEHRAYTDTPR